MLQIDQFRLPIGFKFTKRLWSHQDFKRRTDYSMQIEWSNKEYYYHIQVQHKFYFFSTTKMTFSAENSAKSSIKNNFSQPAVLNCEKIIWAKI